MGFSGVMLALSAVQGINSIGQGYAQASESKYNAQLATNQAELQKVQGDITQGQYTRQAGQMFSSSTAAAGASGVMPTGSVAATILDAQTQIHTDMAIARFNTQMSINQSNAQATALKQQASQQVYAGFSGAFSDVLSGAEKYYTYKNDINKK